MSDVVADKELGAAVLGSIQSGDYPESEQVASANLSKGALQHVISGLADARDKVEGEIKQLSRGVAPDVDDWIQQATKLQADIDASKITAREIVEAAEQANKLQNENKDAAIKHELLGAEVAFNERLEQTLAQIRGTVENLRNAQQAAARDDIVTALSQMRSVNAKLADLGPKENSNAVGLLLQRSQKLRGDISEVAKRHWHTLIHADPANSAITIKQEVSVNEEGNTLSLAQAAEISDELANLDADITTLSRDIDTIILRPLLVSSSKNKSRVAILRNSITLLQEAAATTTLDVLQDINKTAAFLNHNLPPKIATEVAEILLPLILQRLTTNWLNGSVPTAVNEMGIFQELLTAVSQLAENLSSIGWTGVTKLNEWTEQAPTTWLARRREVCLTDLRKNIVSNIEKVKTVERVETQVVSSGDALVSGDDETQDWDTAWEDDAQDVQPAQASDVQTEEDEDASAWEVDEEPHTNGNGSVLHDESGDSSKREEDEGDTDAWGWGDEKDSSAPASPATKKKPEPPTKVNGDQPSVATGSKELTLKETYNITMVPDEIQEMILQTITDAETLRNSAQSSSPIAPAALGLYSLPALILAGYRALAPLYYQALPGGNMYLYNDCLRLSSELTSFNEQQMKSDAKSAYSDSTKPTTRMKLPGEIAAIESFGRRAYGTEMDSQRTVLRDLLDGAQGFSNCTESPFKGECENAIAMTSDRLRDVSKQWSSILSRSALLQSVGSLLNTILNKMIVDIEDMTDIGAEESSQLRAFFNEITKSSDLFIQESPDGEQNDTVHVYAPEWFKFQYLAEILDSSLVDITSLWEDGSLKMDFEATEVVDLVEALFADSSHRKNAIRRIRAG